MAALPQVQPAFRERLRAPAGRAPRRWPPVLKLDQRADTAKQPSPGEPVRRLRLPGRDLKELLGDAVPRDHARQTLADGYIDREIGRSAGRPWRVLDLGCGMGESVDSFRARDTDVDWVGLDVPGSPEARERARTDARFETFDGISMPFGDGSFELVYCKQVLEHVRHPEPLLAEVQRVLAPGGWFAGSTSQLELYHSLSVWNYTPYGLVQLLEQAGLRPVELRPGIDGLTLIAWRAAGGHPYFHRWWGRESPFNRLLDLSGRLVRADPRALNSTKLLFCGQFAFLARRHGEPA
jgi:SAM-dependent methyltransferase